MNLPKNETPETRKARTRDAQFQMRPLAAVLRVLAINLRGTMKIKPEGGTVRLPVDPCAQGSIANIVFFKSGAPYAMALIKEITRNMGDWIVEYTNVEWLSPNQPQKS